jgi:muconate cycloisomerase
VRVEDDGVQGLGEAAEFSILGVEQSLASIGEDLTKCATLLSDLSAWQRIEAERRMQAAHVCSAARAGVDIALHDWAGKMANRPIWRLLGIENRSQSPTSVTIGISTPRAAQERLAQWVSQGTVRAIKVKLGSRDGIDADRRMMDAILEVAPDNVSISVDANGGWNIDDAVSMCRWLAERNIDHVEQPLVQGCESQLGQLKTQSSIPIILDESCCSSADVVRYASVIDGVNIKLMKCGGITEALRMIHSAKSFGLKVMLGCYSNTVLGNTAANQLASLVDYIDLDSHLNLVDDPFVGAAWLDGFLINNDLPGIGVAYANAS